MWTNEGWGQSALPRWDSLISPVWQKPRSSLSSADIFGDTLPCTGDTEMNKIPFLLIRSSWPNRKIDMTTVTHRSKCYYRDENQKTSHLNCAFKNESVEILAIGDYRS